MAAAERRRQKVCSSPLGERFTELLNNKTNSAEVAKQMAAWANYCVGIYVHFLLPALTGSDDRDEGL